MFRPYSAYLLLAFFLGFLTACEPANTSKNEEITEEEAVLSEQENIAPEATLTAYSAAFYNVENLFDTEDDPKTLDEDFLPSGDLQWTEERYADKLEKLAEIIGEIGDEDGPEFVGLAEIENEKVLKDLIAQAPLAGRNYKIAHRDSPDRRGIDAAVLYKAGFFTPSEIKNYPVVRRGDGKFLTRDILLVSGKTPDGKMLHILANHWPSRREGEEESEPNRLLAAQKLREITDKLLQEDRKAKILIFGDFNDMPDNNSIRETLRANARPNFPSGELLNLTANASGSYNYRGDWQQLDQIIVSEGLARDSKAGLSVGENTAEVYKPEKLLQQKPAKYKGLPMRTYAGKKYLGGYSDHLPVFVRFNFRKAE